MSVNNIGWTNVDAPDFSRSNALLELAQRQREATANSFDTLYKNFRNNVENNLIEKFKAGLSNQTVDSLMSKEQLQQEAIKQQEAVGLGNQIILPKLQELIDTAPVTVANRQRDEIKAMQEAKEVDRQAKISKFDEIQPKLKPRIATLQAQSQEVDRAGQALQAILNDVEKSDEEKQQAQTNFDTLYQQWQENKQTFDNTLFDGLNLTENEKAYFTDNFAELQQGYQQRERAKEQELDFIEIEGLKKVLPQMGSMMYQQLSSIFSDKNLDDTAKAQKAQEYMDSNFGSYRLATRQAIIGTAYEVLRNETNETLKRELTKAMKQMDVDLENRRIKSQENIAQAKINSTERIAQQDNATKITTAQIGADASRYSADTSAAVKMATQGGSGSNVSNGLKTMIRDGWVNDDKTINPVAMSRGIKQRLSNIVNGGTLYSSALGKFKTYSEFETNLLKNGTPNQIEHYEGLKAAIASYNKRNPKTPITNLEKLQMAQVLINNPNYFNEMGNFSQLGNFFNAVTPNRLGTKTGRSERFVNNFLPELRKRNEQQITDEVNREIATIQNTLTQAGYSSEDFSKAAFMQGIGMNFYGSSITTRLNPASKKVLFGK